MQKYVDALDLLQSNEATRPFMENVRAHITPEFLYYEWDAKVPCFIVEHHGKYYDVQDTMQPWKSDFDKMNSYNSPLMCASAIVDRWSEMQEV